MFDFHTFYELVKTRHLELSLELSLSESNKKVITKIEPISEGEGEQENDETIEVQPSLSEYLDDRRLSSNDNDDNSDSTDDSDGKSYFSNKYRY